MQTARKERPSRSERLELARVLVVDDDVTSRLTLQTVLEAGGYRVDSAASAAEAVDKLDGQEYQLVLSDPAGFNILSYAQAMTYKPATAVINSEHSGGVPDRSRSSFLVAPEDIPGLLSKVANLIARRVTRRVNQELRQSKN